MELKQSERKQARIKMALKGTSGSGKSVGALLMAKGLCHGDLSKTAVIDTENSIELYSHIGNFKVLSLTQPFSPERYIAAIETCERAGIEVIIIDSLSHCWYYLLQFHASIPGNSFTNWNRITPLHNLFIQKIQQSPCHIICTIRTKQDYIIHTDKGKTQIEKVGLKVIQRDEIEYEFTTVLDISIAHKAKATKDRTNLFMDKPEFTITEQTGIDILNWCNCNINVDDVKNEIIKSTSIDQLNHIYHQYPAYYQILSGEFIKQKVKLQGDQKESIKINNQNTNNHGTYSTKTN